jgi:hypothetical protein
MPGCRIADWLLADWRDLVRRVRWATWVTWVLSEDEALYEISAPITTEVVANSQFDEQ